VAVLRFTAAGVVEAPTTLQIRVSRELPGRVAAGAPAPGREMTDDEVRDNLHYFAVRRVGPRSVACTAVVLSGVDLPTRGALAPLIDDARGWGVRRVVLHLARGARDALRSSPLRTRVDEVAVGVSSADDLADVAALVRAGIRVVAVVPLDARTLARLDALARALAAARPARVTLTWPLADDDPPHAARVVPALGPPLTALRDAGVQVGIKGLPACTLGAFGDASSRTRNRVYVDAEHQREGALLLFPDVLRFERVDACRFCAAAARCDGAPARALAAGRVGPLRPLPPDGEDGA
jgi:hypothetical protein